MSEPLVCYCLQITGGEFLIEVAQQGNISWDNYQMQRCLRGAEDRYLESKTVLGDASARGRLNAEIDEFTVSSPLGPDLLAQIREAAGLLAGDQCTVARNIFMNSSPHAWLPCRCGVRRAPFCNPAVQFISKGLVGGVPETPNHPP